MMRLTLALACMLVLSAPAGAEADVYLGAGTIDGTEWVGSPGEDLRLKYTFNYTGPMIVSFDQRDFDCDGQSPGGWEVTVEGRSLEPATWTDVETGEVGEAYAYFTYFERVGDQAIPGCAGITGYLQVGPAGLVYEIWPTGSVEGDQLTLDVFYNGENVDGATVTFTGTRAVFLLTVDPGTVNLRSRGRWITTTLLPPEPIPASDIDLTSLAIDGVQPTETAIKDGVVVAKFPRRELAEQLPVGMEVPVTLTGQLVDGLDLVASSTIRVIDPRRSGRATTEATYPAGATASVEWLAIYGDTDTRYDGYISTDGGLSWQLLFKNLRGTNQYSWVLDAEMSGTAEVLVEATSQRGVHHALTQQFQIDGVEVPAQQSQATEYGVNASPNPFNPRTTLYYSLPVSGRAELVVYDLAGRRVKTLVSGHVEAGQHEAEWDGRDEQGRRVASGVYLYNLVSGEFSETKRMVLLK